jgi:hypothetical protein
LRLIKPFLAAYGSKLFYKHPILILQSTLNFKAPIDDFYWFLPTSQLATAYYFELVPTYYEQDGDQGLHKSFVFATQNFNFLFAKPKLNCQLT